jgi:hypothetical protein
MYVRSAEMPERLRQSEPDRCVRPDPEPAGPAPVPPHAVLTLQTAAGNQAVARALLQRDALGLVTQQFATPVVPGLNTPLDPSIMAGLEKRQQEIQARVRAWMVAHRAEIQGQVVAGMSLPEVIDFVRTGVKDATELAPETIGKLAQAVVSPMAIAPHRLENREKELAAELRNALAKVPTELKIGGAGAWAKISISGLEAAAKIGGAELTGEGGPSSGAVGVKKGGAEAKAEFDWDEKTIALDTTVGPIGLGGKIGMGKRGSPDSWEIHIGVPRAGALGPLLPSTQKAVGQAGEAVSGIIRHLRSGGKPGDDVVQDHLKTIKKGIEPLSKLTVENAVSFGISVSGDGPDVRVEASLIWRF